MIIQEEDFKLIPCSEEAVLFDLDIIATINKGKDNERKEFGKNVYYGITLGHAIKLIKAHRIEEKYPADTVISLDTYFKEWKKLESCIKNLLQ